jgi:hypothetical protein
MAGAVYGALGGLLGNQGGGVDGLAVSYSFAVCVLKPVIARDGGFLEESQLLMQQ